MCMFLRSPPIGATSLAPSAEAECATSLGGEKHTPAQALEGQWATCKDVIYCDDVTVQNSTRLTIGKPTHLGITTSHLHTRAMPTEVVSAQLNGHSVACSLAKFSARPSGNPSVRP
jgi:hypothetical protein